MGPVWGIDLGGTKIEGVVLEDPNHPVVLKRLRVATEKEKGYQHIIGQIVKLVEVLMAETGVRPMKIGIGTPGTLEPSTQTMKNSNTTAINGKYLKRDLERALSMPVSMANDANCFAIAETQLGVVKEELPEAKVVFGVIMGTGVGGGLIIDGKVINGKQGIAGEWGHNFMDASGGKCYCGKSGCVERILSGPSLERYYFDKMGIEKTLPEIVQLHEGGNDEVATETIKRLLKFFGQGIASVINVVDPDAVVIGGGVSKVNLLYDQGIKSIENHVFNHRLETPILRPSLGDSAGVFGAALL